MVKKVGEKLVDDTSGYDLLSFMDAYSGYNQIQMHPKDKEKTTFITNSGNFYYNVMSYGLKNIGAIYQQLMDRIFKDQISREMEVYVDDMVVKSPDESRHCKALTSVFTTL
ncbi:Retrovirus-related Pol polyprotein from transposon gypsy, partial [Mucuna pruriens]